MLKKCLNYKYYSDPIEIWGDGRQKRELVLVDDFVDNLLTDNNDIELWLYLDQILLELSGQEFTWNQLLDYYQKNYKNIIENVLPKT
jgi:nucleoside-diphosphate-sugar epimerase